MTPTILESPRFQVLRTGLERLAKDPWNAVIYLCGAAVLGLSLFMHVQMTASPHGHGMSSGHNPAASMHGMER
jgi:hypothetical protein